MIKGSEIKKIVNDYSDVKIGVLGSHSALEIMDGAKDENFETKVFCQKGREGPYQRFGRIADEIIVLNKFKDMASAKNQKNVKGFKYNYSSTQIPYGLFRIQNN
jgi:ATP-utilizing enzymes of ATP-grasp superfamily (probably carboligases)